jgi:surface antigen
MSNTETGVLGGAGIGAVLGGIVGHFCHNTAAGVAVGAVAGGVTGGVIGNQVDKKEQQQAIQAVQAQQAAHGPIGLQEIATMAQNHISDQIIINQIQTSGAFFTLTVDQVTYLHQYGVSDAVIEFMQRPARPVVVAQPGVVYGAPPPAVVVAPAPYYYGPPPVAVGVGVRIH